MFSVHVDLVGRKFLHFEKKATVSHKHRKLFSIVVRVADFYSDDFISINFKYLIFFGVFCWMYPIIRDFWKAREWGSHWEDSIESSLNEGVLCDNKCPQHTVHYFKGEIHLFKHFCDYWKWTIMPAFYFSSVGEDPESMS